MSSVVQLLDRAFARIVPGLALVAGLTACARGTSTAPSSGDDASLAVAAATAFVDALPDSVRAEGARPFDDSARTAFNYVPMTRAGVPFARLDTAGRRRAHALLRTALSERGYATATGIVRQEAILRALEEAQGLPGASRRDSMLYYTAVFGQPAAESAWGWRFEGHHVSVNVTRAGREPQVVAPLFMGANPARVPSGPRAGQRLLALEEDIGRRLFMMLPAERRTRATIADNAYGDIVTRNDPKVQGLAMAGLPASEMSRAERAVLRELLNVYLARMAPAAARAQLARIERAGFGRLHFGWAGTAAPGGPHYYRIHGPTVLVEYDNVQNGANHVHTVWRDLENDFGGDLLRAHYARHRH